MSLTTYLLYMSHACMQCLGCPLRPSLPHPFLLSFCREIPGTTSDVEGNYTLVSGSTVAAPAPFVVVLDDAEVWCKQESCATAGNNDKSAMRMHACSGCGGFSHEQSTRNFVSNSIFENSKIPRSQRAFHYLL